MPQKKNGFFMFMKDHRDKEIKLGKRPSSYDVLKGQLTQVWNGMNVDQKYSFKVLADEYNSKIKEKVKKKVPQPQINTNFNACNRSQLLADTLLDSVSSEEELINKKFILLHINSHTYLSDDYYFPAEIAALEFNLKNGVLRVYHTIIGLSKIYPRGSAGGMREYSNAFHQIPCWELGLSEDYKSIMLDFLSFLKGKTLNETDVCDDNLELPDMFTIEREPAQNLIAVNSSLDRLCRTAFPNRFSEDSNSILKVKSVERLFLHIMKYLNLNLNPLTIMRGNLVHDVLETSIFGKGLSCDYHEMRDIAYKCSSARILQWMTNMFVHLNTLSTNLTITPGKHIPLTMRDGSKMFLHNMKTPLSIDDIQRAVSQKNVLRVNGPSNMQEKPSTSSQSHSNLDGSMSQ